MKPVAHRHCWGLDICFFVVVFFGDDCADEMIKIPGSFEFQTPENNATLIDYVHHNLKQGKLLCNDFIIQCEHKLWKKIHKSVM